MIRGRIQDIMRITGGTLIAGKAEKMFVGISTDSRLITKGELFVALSGENFNGHNFILEAAKRGASAAMVMQDSKGPRHLPIIKVDDTLKALGLLARAHRQKWQGRMVGVTGSAGKTTVKEMTASILEQAGNTLKTQKNFNNLIGVPMRLFDLKPKHEYAVIEMGTNSPGEIDRLASMVLPEISILTNVTPAHLDGLHGIEGVVTEKQTIFTHTSRTAVFNPQGQHMERVHIPQTLEHVTFGAPGADVTAGKILKQTLDGTEFMLNIRGTEYPVHLKLPGAHNILNALAAAAAGLSLGIEPQLITQGLENAVFPSMRSEIIFSEKLTIIDDSYNANPASMKAALDMLTSAPHTHKIAVLGDMLELGQDSGHWHAQLGEYVAMANIDMLIVTGSMAQTVAEAATKNGMPANNIFTASGMEEIESMLSRGLGRESIVLIKASRGLKLDRVVSFLKKVA